MDRANGQAQHALGLAYYELGDLYNAAVHLNIASRLLRDRVEPCHNLGIVLEEGGKYELAMEAYERARKHRSDHLPTLENLARVRIKAGLHDRETLQLLNCCLEREVRPDWSEWLTREALRLSARLGSEQSTLSTSKTHLGSRREVGGEDGQADGGAELTTGRHLLGPSKQR